MSLNYIEMPQSRFIDYCRTLQNLNTRDEYGVSPLMVACMRLDWESIDFLLEKGANPKTRTYGEKEGIDSLTFFLLAFSGHSPHAKNFNAKFAFKRGEKCKYPVVDTVKLKEMIDKLTQKHPSLFASKVQQYTPPHTNLIHYYFTDWEVNINENGAVYVVY